MKEPQQGKAGDLGSQMDRDQLIEILRHERSRLEEMFALAPAFIATLRGHEHRFEMANPLYRELIGDRDPVGQTVRQALPEAEEQGFISLLDQVYRTGEPFVGNEMPIEVNLDSSGEMVRYYLNFVYYPLRDANGAIDGIFVHGVDVTNLVAARKEAEAANRRLSVLAEASMILGSSLDYQATLANLTKLLTSYLADWCTIVIVLPGGGVKRVAISHRDPEVEPLMQRLLASAAPNAEQNRTLFEALESGEVITVPEVTEELLSTISTHPDQLELVERLGLHSALVAPMLVRDKVTGAIFLARSHDSESFNESDADLAVELARRASVAVDNTQLFREAEELNRELEFRVQERTKELESFSYSVSHDLRAPLRAIDGFSLALVEDHGSELETGAQRYLERIRAAAKRMGELIDDLLKLSRVARSERNDEPVDLSTIATVTLESLHKREPQRKVDVEIESGLEVVGDKSLLTVLLENLLENAWKFTSRKERALIEVGSTETERGVAYYVRDNGAGFDMLHAERLFGAFQRLHDPKEFEGTGVGLATAQRVVHRHNGSIWAKGEAGKGATFYFTLGN